MIKSRIAYALCLLLMQGAFVAGQDTPVQPAAEEESMHVLVGKSVVINVQAPLTRVLSSNPAVVETMATSPTQVVVEGKAAGNSSLILWDASGQSQIMDVAVDIDVAGLRNAIERSYPHEKLDVEADAGRLVLTGTVANAHIVDDLSKMAAAYSTQVVNSVQVPVSHERQIVLEVKFAEVDRTALAQLGFNWLSTGAGNTLGSTTTGQFGAAPAWTITDIFGGGAPHFPFESKQTIDNALNVFLFRPDLHLGVAIQALQQKNVLQILAEPNLMAMNGQKATFLAGGEFPFPIIQPGSGGFNQVTIQFKPFGVKLEFTGFVEDDDTLRIHIAPEVSALDYTNALTLSGFNIPAISTRRAETEIELKNGQAFAIAGLLDRRATTQLSKMPGIGDIPILGQFFRSKSVNQNNSELLVLVTPHIIDPVHQETSAPAGPKLAVPFLDQQAFDTQLPGKNAAVKSQNPGAK